MQVFSTPSEQIIDMATVFTNAFDTVYAHDHNRTAVYSRLPNCVRHQTFTMSDAGTFLITFLPVGVSKNGNHTERIPFS